MKYFTILNYYVKRKNRKQRTFFSIIISNDQLGFAKRATYCSYNGNGLRVLFRCMCCSCSLIHRYRHVDNQRGHCNVAIKLCTARFRIATHFGRIRLVVLNLFV